MNNTVAISGSSLSRRRVGRACAACGAAAFGGVGTDNDDQGKVYWKLLLALGADSRQFPESGKDWNNELVALPF